MAPKLYYISGSPGVRAVMVTANLLGIEFELHQLDFLKKEHLTPAYLKVHLSVFFKYFYFSCVLTNRLILNILFLHWMILAVLYGTVMLLVHI